MGYIAMETLRPSFKTIWGLGKTKNITYAKRTRPRANQVKKPFNPSNPCSNPPSKAVLVTFNWFPPKE